MTTPPPPDRGVERFDRAARAAHWATAVLVVVLALTGAGLASSTLMAVVGRRRLVELVHLVAGLALPLPLLVAAGGRWGRRLRADLGTLNRWQALDRAWLRAAVAGRRRPLELPSGKFNAGQKLNAAFSAGALLVLLATGVIMFWFHPWPLAWRTGATSTHDWVALAVVIAEAGHVRFAFADREALRSMRTGRVSRAWAARVAPLWLDEPAAVPPDRPA